MIIRIWVCQAIRLKSLLDLYRQLVHFHLVVHVQFNMYCPQCLIVLSTVPHQGDVFPHYLLFEAQTVLLHPDSVDVSWGALIFPDQMDTN